MMRYEDPVLDDAWRRLIEVGTSAVTLAELDALLAAEDDEDE